MAQKRHKVWQLSRRSPGPAIPVAEEKHAIVGACETFIREVLKPRFLREITPAEEIGMTNWNYLIDIHGAWTAGRYRFMQRYRSAFPHNRGYEFDAPFARIDRMGPDLFDIKWMRHTGQWWPVYSGKTLAEALHILETDPVLRPY
jgi:hypothetical protein